MKDPKGHASPLQLIGQEWRTAWRPGVGALIAGSLGYSLYPAVSSLFVASLEAQFGWSRGDIAFVHSFGIATAFAAPIWGRLADRHDARPILLAGLVMTALGYALLSQMSGSLGVYYAIYFVFMIVGMATTGLTVTHILSGAFDRTRGTALAIGRSGLAISGAVMPLLLFPVIARTGTTGGYLVLAGFCLLIAAPAVWFLVPKRQTIANAPRKVDEPPPSWGGLLAKPKVRILIAASVLNYVPVVALLSQLQPLGVSKGLDAATALGAVSIMGIAAAGGALLSGLLVDRF